MARNITLTLGPGLGSNLGPNFNLTANSGVVTPSTATRTELLAGKIVSVDDIASQATITSIGTCTNAISQTIICTAPTVTLSFDEFRVDETAGALGNVWSFVLVGGTIPFLLNIDDFSVITYTDIDCTSGAATSSATGLQIPANISGGLQYTTAINCSVRPRYKRVNGFTLNGTPVVHGQTVTISGYNILINISADCSILDCIE